MKTISAIVIAKNEEKMIKDCLTSLSFCDEIIVIDNSSTDNTSSIVKKMNAKAFDFETDDFSKLRNFGLEKAHGDWVLYVDADERVPLKLKEEIESIIQEDLSLDAYKIKRKNFYFGNYEWPYIEKIERLFKKKSLNGWEGRLHESPIIDGRIGEAEYFLIHYTHENLSSMVGKTIEWSETEVKLRLEANHPKMMWWRFPRVMISAFINSYIVQGGWKVGTAGFVESIYQVFSIFITYAKLWEKQLKVKNEK